MVININSIKLVIIGFNQQKWEITQWNWYVNTKVPAIIKEHICRKFKKIDRHNE